MLAATPPCAHAFAANAVWHSNSRIAVSRATVDREERVRRMTHVTVKRLRRQRGDDAAQRRAETFCYTLTPL
jgi:hypothetical protein